MTIKIIKKIKDKTKDYRAVKDYRESKQYRESVKMYNIWEKEIKKLEEQGHHGTDYYVRRVSELEGEIKILKNKLKKMKSKNA